MLGHAACWDVIWGAVGARRSPSVEITLGTAAITASMPRSLIRKGRSWSSAPASFQMWPLCSGQGRGEAGGVVLGRGAGLVRRGRG